MNLPTHNEICLVCAIIKKLVDEYESTGGFLPYKSDVFSQEEMFIFLKSFLEREIEVKVDE